ncbi:MAG: polysaccharide deacetylase family protein [Bacillota bacterium]|nr:polysaccharide deacetylase family protein [Bacillota bacterium]
MKYGNVYIKRKIILFLLLMLMTCGMTAGHCFFAEISGANAKAEDAGSIKSGNESVFLPVIMYHSVKDGCEGQGEYVISAETLEEDLKWLDENGYETVFVEDVINYVKYGGNLPDNPVMITFDDGMLDNMKTAFRVMEKYGARGVYSVVGSYCEGEYGYMTWADILEFDSSPLVEIQNHSFEMHGLESRKGSSRMKGEGLCQYITAFASDASKMQILLEEKAGIKAECYTYPFGIISEETVPVLKCLGFEASLTCYERENIITRGDSDCLYLINRYNRGCGESTEKFMKRMGMTDKSK